MAVALVERDSLLSALDAYLDDALGGRGRLVFLGGEAGAGKSSLISCFADRVNIRVLRGFCDGGTTPRPLGPLVDIATGAIHEQLAQEEPNRDRLFHTALAVLGEQPTLLIIEDTHWADEATLDWIRFLARRMDDLPLLAVTTFRDDEVGASHPLTVVMGDIATAAVVARMQVPPLTPAAVAELASGAAVDPVDLHRRTGGNAFFVTEALAAGAAQVPPSVRDAVYARAARLSPPARQVLAVASVIGRYAEIGLLLGVCGQSPAAVDECVERGLLVDAGHQVGFRHELARQAIDDGLPATTRVRLHHTVLERLLAGGETDDRRLAHHADRCGAAAAVVRHASLAAARAVRFGAHREAAEHYRAVLRHAHVLPDAERAVLLGKLAYECYLTDQSAEALAAFEQALAIHRAAGDQLQVGVALRWLSRLSWFIGRSAVADRFATEAVATLEQLSPGPELAMAFSNLSQLRMLADDSESAVEWGTKAIELARRHGADDVLVHAYNNIGAAQILAGQVTDGVASLRQSLDLALAADTGEHAARAYTNLGSSLTSLRQLAIAEDWLRTGIGYCLDHDLDSWRLYMEAWLARVLAERGRYDAARRLARAILRHPQLSLISRIPALAVAGTLAVRLGEPDAHVLLDEAAWLAGQTGERQRIVPVAVARAELAWTVGDVESIGAATDTAWQLALDRGTSWDVGELAWWRHLAGLPAPERELPEPFTLLFAGRVKEAATAWARLDCPLWQALALSQSDSQDHIKEALAILDNLPAPATVAAVTRDLRRRGVAVPRGPRQSTQDNPAGLTARELEILQLLAHGLSNAELAALLRLSKKTVGHHVSAVLRKLGVPSRTRAVAKAVQLGIPMTATPPN